jgi:hypothetical protein
MARVCLRELTPEERALGARAHGSGAGGATRDEQKGSGQLFQDNEGRINSSLR